MHALPDPATHEVLHVLVTGFWQHSSYLGSIAAVHATHAVHGPRALKSQGPDVFLSLHTGGCTDL